MADSQLPLERRTPNLREYQSSQSETNNFQTQRKPRTFKAAPTGNSNSRNSRWRESSSSDSRSHSTPTCWADAARQYSTHPPLFTIQAGSSERGESSTRQRQAAQRKHISKEQTNPSDSPSEAARRHRAGAVKSTERSASRNPNENSSQRQSRIPSTNRSNEGRLNSGLDHRPSGGEERSGANKIPRRQTSQAGAPGRSKFQRQETSLVESPKDQTRIDEAKNMRPDSRKSFETPKKITKPSSTASAEKSNPGSPKQTGSLSKSASGVASSRSAVTFGNNSGRSSRRPFPSDLETQEEPTTTTATESRSSASEVALGLERHLEANSTPQEIEEVLSPDIGESKGVKVGPTVVYLQVEEDGVRYLTPVKTLLYLPASFFDPSQLSNVLPEEIETPDGFQKVQSLPDLNEHVAAQIDRVNGKLDVAGEGGGAILMARRKLRRASKYFQKARREIQEADELMTDVLPPLDGPSGRPVV